MIVSFWRHARRGLRALVNRGSTDDDVRDEVQDYIDRAAAAHAAGGLSPDQSMRAARLELGNPTAAAEQIRSYGWENFVDTLLADFKHAFRRLRADPGFTVVSVLTLALGIGAASAIFSAVNPILFASLPYPRADRLVTLTDHNDDGTLRAPTFGTFAELRARTRSFVAMAAADKWEPSLTGTSQPERLHGQRVSAGYFNTLGVRPAVGRDFGQDEDRAGGPNVAIVSARLVRRRFAGDSAIIGRRILVDDNQYLIIGVMPLDFDNVTFPAADIWAPMQAPRQTSFNTREWGHHYQIIARLSPGMTPDRAARETKAIGGAPVPEYPRPPWAALKDGLVVRSLQDDIASDARPTLLAIVGAAFLLLAIACVNVTNLLFARGAQRRGEFAMRVALGAGRGRLLRQLVTESLVLALAGGALGLFVARIGIRALVLLSPPGLPRLDAIRLDAPVFLFALTVTTLVGLIVGIVPALAVSRTDLRDRLQRGSRRTSSGTGIARSALVVAEVALALVLLTGAGLLMRSLQRLFAVSAGIDANGVMTMQVVETGTTSHADSARARFLAQALDAVRRVPGVTSAAFTSQLPLSGELDGYGYEVQSKPSVKPGEDGSAMRYAVSPEYFKTMRIPLLRGRTLDSSDVTGAPEAIVVSESFARQAFGNANPIGQRVRFGPETNDPKRPWDLVVGVVGDVKQVSLASTETQAFYVATVQWWWVDNVQSLVVRTTGDPAALGPSLKRAVWSVNANQPIQRVVSMEGLISASASQRRFALIVIETFAIVALVLAAIGLYGVISGSVAERTREIGIRAALGATPRGIVSGVVGRGALLAAVGAAIGVLAAVPASTFLSSLLFGISRLDPMTYVLVVVLLGLVALLACWIPANRAAGVDPAITLRAD
jgi:putative ABC transport system permease protein